MKETRGGDLWYTQIQPDRRIREEARGKEGKTPRFSGEANVRSAKESLTRLTKSHSFCLSTSPHRACFRELHDTLLVLCIVIMSDKAIGDDVFDGPDDAAPVISQDAPPELPVAEGEGAPSPVASGSRGGSVIGAGSPGLAKEEDGNDSDDLVSIRLTPWLSCILPRCQVDTRCSSS